MSKYIIESFFIPLKSFGGGIVLLLKNLIPFMKMCKAFFALLFVFALYILFTFLLSGNSNYVTIIKLFCLPLLFAILALGIVWRVLFELAAVSLLVKDISKNTPLKKPKEYIAQIDEYGKKYVYILFISTLIFIVLSCLGLFAAVFALAPLKTIIMIVFQECALIIPEFWIINWALNDKTNPNKSLKQALSFICRNILAVIVIFLLLFMLFSVVTLLFCPAIVAMGYPDLQYLLNNPNVIYDEKFIRLTIFASVFLSFACIFYTYIARFILTNVFMQTQKTEQE